MKRAMLLSFIIFAPTGHAADAAQFDGPNYSDIEVVSVTPRTRNLKPFVMAVFTKEQQQRLAAAAFQKGVLPTKNFNLLR